MRWAVGGIIGSAALSRCARVPRAVRHPGWKHTWLYVISSSPGGRPCSGRFWRTRAVTRTGWWGPWTPPRATGVGRKSDRRSNTWCCGAEGVPRTYDGSSPRCAARAGTRSARRAVGCGTDCLRSGRGATRPWSFATSIRCRRFCVDRAPQHAAATCGSRRRNTPGHGASERLRGAVPTVHQLTGSRRLAIRSAGVSQPSVFRGRLLSPAATASGRSSVCGEKPMSLGKFCRRRPLVFSFEPRCQGLAV